MPLDKQLVDIPIIAGLEQKWDPRLAPLGVSLTAKNLVKTKRNALRKRLGFTQLSRLNAGSTFYNATGLNLGTHQDKLVIFGKSHALSNGQRINAASVYSDGLAATQPISCVPEVLVKPKTYSASVDGLAYETDTVAFGDYLITVWSANSSPDLSSTGAGVYYNVIESDSGNLVANGTVDSGTAYSPRVFVVGGTTPVVTYVIGGQVYGQIFNSSLLYFSNKATLASIDGGYYDADALGGLSYFSLVYKNNGTITVSTNSISSNVFVSQGTATVTDSNKPAGTTVPGFGIVGNNASGYIIVAFSYQDASGNTTVDAAAVSTSSLNANVTAATLWSTSSAGGMNAPKALAIVDLGIISGTQSWGIAWGCPYSNLTKTGYNAGAEPYTFFTSIILNAGVPEKTPGSVFPSSTFGIVPVSRFAAYNGSFYILCFVPSKYQGSYYLCSVDNAALPSDTGYFPLRPVATIAPRQALCDGRISSNFPLNATIGSTSTLTHVTFTSTNSQYANAALSVMTTPTGSKTVPAIYQLEFNSRHLYRSAQLGPCLVHTSGMPSALDGAASVEIGFPYYPEVPNPKTSVAGIAQIQYANWGGTPGGGSTGTSSAGPYFSSPQDTYNWIFTYEWVDAQGQTHISARSPVVTITGADVVAAGLTLPTTVNVIFRVPSSGIGYRVLNRSASSGAQSHSGTAGKVTIGMYRNTQNSPATYQRVGDPQHIGTTDGLWSGGGNGYNSSVYNAPSGYASAGYAAYVMMIDASYDQATGTASGTPNISGNALLYSDGSDGTTGNLDNLNGPSTSVLVQHKNRIFIADGNQVWFTKVYTPGEGPGFNETAMMFPVGDSSPITGLASMDDKLVIFKRKSIYYVSGEGPEDNGQNGEFGEPIPVPTEIGCEDGRSIVTTPEGVYFYSDAGLRLLDRSLTVQYVGVSIEDEVSTYPYITSAVLHPNTNRMIVCANTNDTDTSLTGEFLYRDYSLDAWTTGQLAAAGNGNGGPIAAGIGIAPYTYGEEPVLHLLTADGYVWRENDIAGAGTVYEDDGYFVPSTLKMSWLKPAQSIEGFGRIWRVNLLADMLDPAQLTVSVYTDYDSTTASNTAIWNPTDLSQTSPAFPQVVVKNQRCSAISVTITDAAPTDGSTVVSGQGWNLLGLALEAGVYPGGRRAASGDRK